METYNISGTSSTRIYYLFRCDDPNRPSTMQTDESYSLDRQEEAYKLKDELDKLGVNYDFLIERWDSGAEEILSNDYVVQNNYKNN
jgi:hypothetical protein